MKEDLRVKKTKAGIRNAFRSLLNRKSFKDITVQNILDEAAINRATFYRYYSDKYALAEQIMEECFQSLMEIVRERFVGGNVSMDRLAEMTVAINERLKEYRLVLLGLWDCGDANGNYMEALQADLKRICERKIREECPNAAEEEIDYTVTIYASFVLSTIRWALEQESEIDTKRVFSFATRFMIRMMGG